VDTGLTDSGHYQSIIWNSATVPDGTHTLLVLAHQESTGTVTATASVSITVTNGLAIVSPAAGSTVSGSVTVSVTSTLSASNDSSNSLTVDGVNTGLTDSGHYQSIIWNSAGIINGTHTLTVMAHQESTGTVTAQASVSVSVGNGSPAASFQIGVDSASHAEFGLYYPATYVFGIPGGSSGLTAQYRYDTSSAWVSLPQETSSNFFNGLAAARFAYPSNTVYISVPFSSSSDTIYVQVINSAMQPVLMTFQGIPKYYDNRKAAVTVDLDDVSDANMPDFIQAISLTAAKNLHVTAAVITGETESSSSWSTIQSWVNAGLTEAASHTRTHPCTDADYQVLGYTSEVTGSRDDLLSNLDLPNPFIPTFVEPCGFTDTSLVAAIAAAQYLDTRSTDFYDNNDYGFGLWDTNGFYDANITTDTDPWPVYTSYPNPGGTAALLSSYNAMFDSVYASGGIYQILDHPADMRWSPGGYFDQHASYIANRNDVWYATLGELYLYHFLQERGLVTVTGQ